MGMAAAGPLAEAADGAAGRGALLRDQRTHGRTSLVGPAARTQFRRLALGAGVRRRFAPHQLRHAHAIEMAREGVPLSVIQRQLGHADLGITSVYLQGIDSGEIVAVVHGRRAPVIPAAVALGP